MLQLLQIASRDYWTDLQSLSTLDNASLIVKALAQVAERDQCLRQSLLASLSANETLSNTFWHFVSHDPPWSPREHGNGVQKCPDTVSSTMLEFHRDLVLLLSKINLLTLGDGVPVEMGTALLEKQHRLTVHGKQCAALSNKSTMVLNPKVSLFEAGCTPQASGNSDWKTRLAEVLQTGSRHQQDSIVRFVGELCRDLEARCGDVERPLRDERAKCEELLSRLESNHSRQLLLEDKEKQQIQALDRLESEKTSLLGRLNLTSQSLQELSDAYDGMQNELERSERSAQTAADAALEATSQAQYTHLAEITYKDEVIEEKTLSIASLETRNSDLERNLAELCGNRTTTLEKLCSLEKTVGRLTQAQQIALNAATERQSIIESQKKAITELHCSKQYLETQLQDCHKMYAKERSGLDAQLLTYRNEVSMLREESQASESAKMEEINRLVSSHGNEMGRLMEHFEQQKLEAAKVLTEEASNNATLQQQLADLLTERENRAKEFAKAQDLSTKLMAVMGHRDNTQTPGNGMRGSIKHARIGASPSFSVMSDPPTPSESVVGSSDLTVSGNVELSPKRPRFQRKPKKSDLYRLYQIRATENQTDSPLQELKDSH